MVQLMRPAYHFSISVIAHPKPFETLMNKHIVHQKVAPPIQEYPYTYCHNPPLKVHRSQHYTQPRWYGEYQEKNIVFLKRMISAFMMVFMQRPQQPMHQVFVSSPCHELHHSECSYHNKYVEEDYQRFNIYNIIRNKGRKIQPV